MLLEIRQFGNSAGITIPKAMLLSAHLAIGDKVEARNVINGIILEPAKPRKKYKIKDLLVLCTNENMVLSSEDKEWLNAKSVGQELLDE